MTSRATVEIVGDVSKFAAGVQRETDRALRHVSLDVKPISDQISAGLERGAEQGADAFKVIDAEFAEIMAEITRSADRHFDLITRDADTAAEEVAHDFGGAGERVEDSLREVGDRSKREFDRVERNARDSSTNIGATFRRLAGTLVAAFAAVQVGRFFLQAAQDAEDLGSAIANTQQIIKSTHSAAGLLATDIREISRQLSLKIGVDSVEVQNAANILLTFKGVSKTTFEETIGLAADLSAVLGSDLSGATLQLGKALNDPVRGVTALARAGVQFTTQQKDQIKALVQSGKLLQAQNIILAEVRSQVGGVAVAGADTTDKLAVAFQDLKREAGESLIGFIDESGPQLIGILEKIGPVVGAVGGAIADALSAALPIIDVLVTNFRDSFAALAPAVQPLAEILSAVLALLPKLIPILVQIGQALLPPIAEIFGTVARALVPVIESVLNLASAILTALAPALGPIGELLSEVASVVGDILLAVLPPLSKIILQVVEAALPLVPVALELLRALLPLAQPITEIVLALAPLITALLPLVQLAASLLTVVAKLATPLLRLASVLVELLVSKAIAPLIGLIAEALTFVLRPVELLVPLLDRLGRFIGNINWADVGRSIGGAFADAWDAVSDFFVGIGRWFSELPGRIGSFLSSLPARITGALQAAFDQALVLIGKGIGLWLAAIIQFPHRFMEALRELPRLLADFVSLLWSGLVALFHLGIDNLVFTFVELPARIVSALSALGGVVGGALWSALKFLGRLVADGVSNLVSFFIHLPGRIVDLVPRMIDAGVSLIRGLFSGLGKVGGFIADVGSGIVNAVRGALNHIVDKINEGIGSIEDNLPFSLPRIPRLARGGLTTRSGLAVVHPTELVLPLEDRRAVDLLGQALAEADAGLRATGVKPATPDGGDIHIRVFLGTRELTDVVDVQIDERNRNLKRRVTAGSGRSR